MKAALPTLKALARAPATPRLLPAVMVTLGVVLSLKAIAAAEAASDAAQTTQTVDTATANAAAAGAEQTAATTSGDSPPAASAAGMQQCPSGLAAAAGLSPSEVQVLQSLGERRKQIEAREAALGEKTDLAAAAERRINERLEELKRLEARVQSLLGQVDEEQTRRLTALVDVYQRMRAKDAAAVFDALEEGVLLQVASRMRQQNLAEIMARMNPDRARALTVKLAETRLPPAEPPSPARKGQPR